MTFDELVMQHKEQAEITARASAMKAQEIAGIRKVLARHFDCFVSDDSIEEAALEVWQEMNPEPEPLF